MLCEIRLMTDTQTRLLEMLRWFDAFCKKNGIEYWLSDGTCLGAIRHEGFIPWDDDIDVAMMREEYLRFEKLFKENDDYALQTVNNDPFYTSPCSKIRDKHSFLEENHRQDINYRFRGIALDIFPQEKIHAMPAKLFLHLRWKLTLAGAKADMTSGEKRRFLTRKKMLFRAISIARPLLKLFPSKRLRMSYGSGWLEEHFLEKEIFPLGQAIFEGGLYPVPGDIPAYLTRIYGNDYMTPPPPENRVVHSETVTFL